MSEQHDQAEPDEAGWSYWVGEHGPERVPADAIDLPPFVVGAGRFDPQDHITSSDYVLGLQQGSSTLNGQFDSAHAAAYFPPPAPQTATVSYEVPANWWHGWLWRLRTVRGFGWVKPRMRKVSITGEMEVVRETPSRIKMTVHATRHWWPIAVELLEDEAPEFAAQFAEHRGVAHQFGLVRSGLGIHGWRCMSCDVGGNL